MADLEAAEADIALIKLNVAEAVRRAQSDTAGIRSSVGERVGGTKDFTQQMLDRFSYDDHRVDDPAARFMGKLADAVGATKSWASNGRAAALALIAVDEKRAKFLLGDGPAICKNRNCGREVWCTPRDRLVSGRCEACHKYWDRHERKEERPAHLCHPTTEKQRVDPTQVVVHLDKESPTTEVQSEVSTHTGDL